MLGRIFDHLSRRAALWVRQWNTTNPDRQRSRYSFVETALWVTKERPTVTVILTWLASSLAGGLGWAAQGCVGSNLIPFDWSDAEVLTYFGTLWTVQATIAALVYPIVIAFVTVLLQRRATAEISLQLYFLDAAVVPAGMSAVALLAWMGIQYIAIPYAQSEWVMAAMLGNSIWFVFNVLWTGRFLYRTLRYFGSEHRLDVFKQLAIQVAFPREVHGRLMGLMLSNAQTDGLLPRGDYTDNDSGPKVRLYPLGEGIPCITVHLRRTRVVADIRLRMLYWGLWLWLRQASKTKSPTTVAGLSPETPLLIVKITPCEDVQGNVALCEVKNGAPPGKFASFCIKHAVVFKRPRQRDASYSTAALLEELALEAVALAEQGRIETARDTIRRLEDLHSSLLSLA